MRYLMCCYASPGVLTLVYLTPSNTKSCIRALTNSMLVCGMTHYANNDNGIGPTYLASLSSLPFQPTCHLFLLTSPSCNNSMWTPVAVGGCRCVSSTIFTHRQASEQAKLQIWRCGEQQAWRLLQGAREGALWAAMSPQTDARSRMPREFGTHKLTKQATLSYLDNYDHVLNFLATSNVKLLHDHEPHTQSRRGMQGIHELLTTCWYTMAAALQQYRWGWKRKRKKHGVRSQCHVIIHITCPSNETIS